MIYNCYLQIKWFFYCYVLELHPSCTTLGLVLILEEAVLKRNEMQCKNFFFSFTFFLKDDQYKNVMNVIKYLDTN